MTRLEKWWLVSTCVATLAACDSTQPSCHVDIDCKGDRICVAGACADPSVSGAGGSGGASGASGVGGSSGVGGIGGSSGVGGMGGSSGVSGTGGGSGTCLDLDCSVIEVGLEAEGLLGDPSRGRMYATVGGSASDYANQLVTIDAATGDILDAVAIGSDPTTLAMSDDASTLWVSVTGAYAIRRVDLTGDLPVPGVQHTLPTAAWGDMAWARQMIVLAGTTDSVAASMHRTGISPSLAGVAIVDSGVARMTQAPGHTGASRLTNGPAGYLFGFNNLHTGYGFYTLTVAPTGVTQVEHSGLVSGSADIVYRDNLVFATSGEVVDVSEPEAPIRAGVFAFDGPVLPIGDGKTLMLCVGEGGSSNPVLHRLDTATFTSVASLEINAESFNSAGNLISPAAGTIAYTSNTSYYTGAGAITIVHAPEFIP